ncbi:ferrous iron transport protein B [candidate division KSB1 bacterium]|nr:ferrous iron transport protein B [candidate division KSB1 bacterium]
MSQGGIQKVTKILRVALAGNPNAGKTSIFNALTGQSQHVGNYPGVTVEKKTGYIKYKDTLIEFVDLPGTYSLTAYSLEEVVARDFVIKSTPDVIIDVIDSTNLERNLYLCLQFQELGVPVVGALNMTDEAKSKGIHIDENLLSRLIGLPFVKTVGTRGEGREQLLEAVLNVAKGQISSTERHLNYGRELETQHNLLIAILKNDDQFAQNYPLHWIAIKLLENDGDAIQKVRAEHNAAEVVLKEAQERRDWIKRHFGEDSEVVVGEQRYAYIHGACKEAVQEDDSSQRIDYTEVIDTIVLNRFMGLLVFILVMFAIYQLTFALGNPVSDLIDLFFAWLQNAITQTMPVGVLRDFLVEGIIGGVGGVLVFFPIVLFLFLGLSFLEDTGYMARAAFVMDKFMHIFGLHGRSFIPMMVSTGCAVPGVMSARTLVNPKDRILTILVAPLMMCGAKTPVIAMLTASFFPENAGLVFWSIWFLSWVLALILARIFRNVFYQGEASPFVMELPPYRLPTVRGVLTHVWEKSWTYVKKAGTFILAASILIWFLLYFPKPPNSAKQGEQNPKIKKIEALTHSFGGRLGKMIEPVFEPCGFDWRIDVALIAGFAAKEVIVSTMGIVYGISEGDSHAELQTTYKSPLKEKLRNDGRYNPSNMLALMIFVLTYIPCIATLGVVKKELGRWRYPIFMAGYTLVIAWVLAAAAYQIGRLIGIG